MYHITHIAQLNDYLLHLPSDSLVFFDFNNTLMMHSDLLFRLKDYATNPLIDHVKYFIKEAKERNIPLEKIFYESVKHPYSFQVIEEDIWSLLSALREKGIKTGVSTSCRTDSLEEIGFIPELFLQKLKQGNLDFSKSFGLFGNMDIEHEGHNILIRDGVIFNNKMNKGTVIKTVLQQIDFVPSHVILVDDLKSNLEESTTPFEDSDIKFLPFHYTYVHENYNLNPMALYQSQIDTILSEKKWCFENKVN